MESDRVSKLSSGFYLSAAILIVVILLLCLSVFLLSRVSATTRPGLDYRNLTERQKLILHPNRYNPSLGVADFGYFDISSNELIILAKIPEIEELYLNECPNIDDSCVEYFRYVPNLKHLSLTKTKVSGEISPSINSLNRLEKLYVGHPAYPAPADLSQYPLFTDDFLINLDLPNLKILHIYLHCVVTDTGLAQLEKFPCLEEVVLHSPFITQERVKQLQTNPGKRKLTKYIFHDGPDGSYKTTLFFGAAVQQITDEQKTAPGN